MNQPANISCGAASKRAFPKDTAEALRAAYPAQPVRLTHDLADHPLLRPDALIALAERMNPKDVMPFSGKVPVGAGESGGAPANGLTPAETIRTIATNESWMVFKHADQDPAYGALLDSLLGEIESIVHPLTGAMLKHEAFIFISSPGSVTPFHFDPEHNILMQISGSKVMTVFSAHDAELTSQEAHEKFHHSGHYTLDWKEELSARGTPQTLVPGDALYVPVKAPHWVLNGDLPSISLSITWRSAWAFAEADAHSFNRQLRRMGITPHAPARWPAQNRAKSLAWRLWRKVAHPR